MLLLTSWLTSGLEILSLVLGGHLFSVSATLATLYLYIELANRKTERQKDRKTARQKDRKTARQKD